MNKLRGSGILIVIFFAIVFSIYTTSAYSEQQHSSIMSKKYEEYIKEEYEREIQNIDEVYDELLYINNLRR